MRIVVCYPPDFSVPTMPFGALPLFNACLRRAGHEVRVVDLAALTFNRLARRANVERLLALLDRELAGPCDLADAGAAQRRKEFSRLRAIPPEMALAAEGALERLRLPREYFEPEALRRDMQSLWAVLQMLAALRPWLDPRNRDFTPALYAHLTAGGADLWTECYEDLLSEELGAFRPDLVAITVPFATQLYGAMRFSEWVRGTVPGVGAPFSVGVSYRCAAGRG